MLAQLAPIAGNLLLVFPSLLRAWLISLWTQQAPCPLLSFAYDSHVLSGLG